MRRHALHIAAAFLLAALPLAAQSRRPLPPVEWKPVCSSATAEPLVPTAAVEAAVRDDGLKACDAVDLYFGIDHPADPAAALRCAYYQRAHANPTIADALAGPGVLSMLYANGRGTPRSYDLAIRFACENTWSSDGDKSLQVPHLLALQSGTATGEFDFCADTSGTLAADACVEVDQRRAGARRRQRLDTVSRGWSAATMAAFKPLQDAEHAFEEARVKGELSWEGTGAPVFAKLEEDRLRDQFVINLERFAKSDVPSASDGQTRSVERDLNAAYQKLQQADEKNFERTRISPAGIKRTEDAWLVLRDAWVAFGRLAYPKLTSNRISTQIARLRVHQLQSLLGIADRTYDDDLRR